MNELRHVPSHNSGGQENLGEGKKQMLGAAAYVPGNIAK